MSTVPHSPPAPNVGRKSRKAPSAGRWADQRIQLEAFAV
jgi:hypothetical protein